MLETREIKVGEAMTVVASVQTDAGCIRDSNEDSGRHVAPNDLETRVSKGTLTIVADGMGGHASGEVASQMAVELISEFYYADDEQDAPNALKTAIEMANTQIFEASASDEKLFGMGTTLVALVVLENLAFSAHVGDSRLYRMRFGQLEMMTTDHSQVMEMVKHGIISMDEARNHDDKNVILRAVGTQDHVEVEVSEPLEIESGDTFLLCSDGLSDMIDDPQIELIMRAEHDIHVKGEQLVAAAKEFGGHDNITVGIVRIDAPETRGINRSVRVTREVEAFV